MNQPNWKSGDQCLVAVDDGSGREFDGVIILASDNGHSLMVSIDDGMIGGCIGMVPLLWNGRYACYETLTGTEVHLKPKP